jgi:hypothetical protein
MVAGPAGRTTLCAEKNVYYEGIPDKCKFSLFIAEDSSKKIFELEVLT